LGYTLTRSVIATDRDAVWRASAELRFAAGNSYINNKPTGAVVGSNRSVARASGRNDTAESAQNLLRWASARTIKEKIRTPVNHLYPHQAPEKASGGAQSAN
jgi:1-pyrroline-5-carboxylate dehydrogenase